MEASVASFRGSGNNSGAGGIEPPPPLPTPFPSPEGEGLRKRAPPPKTSLILKYPKIAQLCAELESETRYEVAGTAPADRFAQELRHV